MVFAINCMQCTYINVLNIMIHELAISSDSIVYPLSGYTYTYTDVTNMKIKDATDIYFQGGWLPLKNKLIYSSI